MFNVRDDELLEAVKKFVARLNGEAERGAVVVVEGIKDVEALQSLGYEGDIYPMCHGGSLEQLVSRAERYSKSILLFDLDSEGRSLTKKAANRLQEKKRSIDLAVRKEFAHVTKGKFRHIQDLGGLRDVLDLSPQIESTR